MSELQAAWEELEGLVDVPLRIKECIRTVLSALDEVERRSLGWKNAMVIHRNFRATKVNWMMKVRDRTARRCAEIAEGIALGRHDIGSIGAAQTADVIRREFHLEER